MRPARLTTLVLVTLGLGCTVGCNPSFDLSRGVTLWLAQVATRPRLHLADQVHAGRVGGKGKIQRLSPVAYPLKLLKARAQRQ